MTATSTDNGPGLDDKAPSTAIVPVASSTAVVPVQAPARRRRPTSGAVPIAGAGLVAEAGDAIRDHRWRDALRILDAIDAIDASSVHTDGLLAVAAIHVNKNRRANEAVGRIRAVTQTIDTHRSLAAVALARHEYLTADTEVRATLELADEDETALDWANLAASYAGLGWFGEATDCLDRAEELGIDESDTWIIGRSANHWGLSKTWALAVSIGLFFFVGLLAVAIGITVPFMVREFRLTQLDERIATLASDAWAKQRWLRLAHAAAVLTIVVAWSFALQMN